LGFERILKQITHNGNIHYVEIEELRKGLQGNSDFMNKIEGQTKSFYLFIYFFFVIKSLLIILRMRIP